MTYNGWYTIAPNQAKPTSSNEQNVTPRQF